MKKIILSLLIILASFSFFDFSTNNCEAWDKTIKVQIPLDLSPLLGEGKCEKKGKGGYECTIESGFGSIKKVVGQIIKYFTFIAGLVGVLFIVINGIMMSMAGVDQSMKENAIKNIQKAIMGIIVLLLSGLILNLIAPWVYN